MSKVICLDENSVQIQSLSKKDKRLAKLIKKVGPITYVPYEDPYTFLIQEILGQLLANKVSRKMFERLVNICNGKITLEAINKLKDDDIKSIGTSGAKVQYIRNLTEAVANNEIDFNELKGLPDEEVIKTLTKLKGVGMWTAKMYLIFVLNREDVLPFEDYAFLQGYGWLYKTNDFSKDMVEKKCKKWRPYRSVAARYIYKALDGGFTKEEFHLYK